MDMSYDDSASLLTNLLLLMICIAILVLIKGCTAVNDDKVWNNGHCSCGGEWVYEQAIGHRYDTDYIYRCNQCGIRYEFDEMR